MQDAPASSSTVLARWRKRYAAFSDRVMCSLSDLERQDVKAFDHWFYRQRGWRWALALCAVATLAAVGASRLPIDMAFGEAALLFNFFAFLLAWVGLTAWFGFRKFQGKMLRTVVVTIALALLGAGVGATIASLARGRDPLVWFTNGSTLRHIVTAVLAFGFLYTGVVATIATLRNRQYVARSARLEAEARQSELKRRLAESQLRMMQLQIEPHFLFNTLGSAQQLAEKGAPDAARLLALLIRFLRAATPALREDTTTLGADAAQASAYLAIMQTRLPGRLDYRVDVPPALADRALPPGMLITLVENAIKHGIEPTPAGGTVTVSARESERDGARVLVLTVADTGAGLGAGAPGQGIGLANIRERLALIYGGRAALELEENAPHGFVARLALPADASLPGASSGDPTTTLPWTHPPR